MTRQTRLTLVRDCALALREVVVPWLGRFGGRANAGIGAGEDVTFTIDAIAGEALEAFLGERAPGVAYCSEDRGLVGAGDGVVESTRPVMLSRNADVGRMFWAYGFRGRPARPTAELLAELIDASSVGGGSFDLGSEAFGMTRIATGQRDAVIEVGSRMIDEVPGMRAAFERIGGGQILNNSPYDMAAPWRVLVEAGGVASDGWGRPLDDRRLLGTGHAFQMSSISATGTELHTALVRAVDDGITRLIQIAGG